jgi:hypothetical protein
MSKIKYINCFGTSFTAGGGFEFDGTSIERKILLNNLYSELEYPLTQFNFSYPGQLNKLLNEKVKVINHAKNGYGNDRIFRQIYEIVSNPDFNKDEHIFIIEYAGLGRKEFWFNPINDYIISNYWFDWDTATLKDEVNLANSYCYDTIEMTHYLEEYEPMFLEFFQHTLKLEKEHKLLFQNIEFFASYLKQQNLNYFYVTDVFDNHIGKNFTFGDDEYFKKSSDFNKFTSFNKLSITDETNNEYTDGHNGYLSNKIIGLTIYNTLIELGLLNLEKVDINWKELKDFKIKNKII